MKSDAPFPGPTIAPGVELPPELAALTEEVWHLSAAGLCLVDEEGRVLGGNRAFAQALGYDTSELPGLSLSQLHPPDAVIEMKALHRALVENAPATVWLGRDMRFQHRRGRPVSGYVRNARFKAGDGRVLRLITLVDLGDMVRSDQQLESLHRAENFNALASAISNDLNNLLSIILGYTALLQEGVVDGRRVRVVSDGVEGAVQRASTLVRQSLYLARRPDPVLRPVSFNEFIEQRMEHLRGHIGERAIELDLSLHRSLQNVPVDQTQLSDAFDELLQRVHAIDPEGLRPVRIRSLSLTGEEVARDYSHATDERYAVIEISHPGRPRTASRQPFTGSDLGDARPVHDLGITMVERIVGAHRGFLAQRTLSNGGLSFTVTLPIGSIEAEAFAGPQVRQPAGAAPAVQGRRVMVIDDEAGLLDTIVETLKRSGYHAVGFKDGGSALQAFRDACGGFDLVICDLVLPKMNGWEVFTGMREIRADAAVVIMSGHLEPKLKDAVQRSGATGFLQKPFSMGAFMRFVRQHVPTESA